MPCFFVWYLFVGLPVSELMYVITRTKVAKCVQSHACVSVLAHMFAPLAAASIKHDDPACVRELLCVGCKYHRYDITPFQARKTRSQLATEDANDG